MEVCCLLQVDQRFLGCDFREVEDYYKRQKLNKNAARTRQQQSKAKLNAQVNQILDKATEAAQKAGGGQSTSSRIKNIRQNREQEHTTERKEQAWDLTRDLVSDLNEQVIPIPVVVQPENDDGEYVPPHRPIDKLRKSRPRKLNDDFD